MLTLSSCGSQRRNLQVSGKGNNVHEISETTPNKDTKSFSPGSVRQALIKEAQAWIGTPYLYGGEELTGADCSGFVMKVYKAATGISLPRTSKDQFEFCELIERNSLFPGDLIFFSSKSSGKNVAHVGIYIGDNQMIHASSSKGVIQTSIDLKYFLDNYISGGRVRELSDKEKKEEKPNKNGKPDKKEGSKSPKDVVKNAFRKK